MSTEKKNILWVDDDVNRLALLPDRDELESCGCKIIEATNPEVFLKMIEDDMQHIDCVIIDISMPTGTLDMEEAAYGTRTGLVLIKKFKEIEEKRNETNPGYKRIPVIVYTVIEDRDVQDFCEQNSIPYLKKTMDSQEFANKVWSVCKFNK